MDVTAQKPALRLAQWTGSMSRSVLRQMIALVSQPGILSFAGGLPDPELFPQEEYAQAMAQVLAQDRFALQYRPPLLALRNHIVELMAVRGVTCTADQVFLTTGAQQGLKILSQLLLDPGGDVLLEEIVYTGMQQVVAPLQPRILTVSTDLETGIDVGAVATHLESGRRPAFIYVIPDAHNPLGVSVSREKRLLLAALARTYGIPIVEDDPYGFLSYDGSAIAPLRAHEESWVFYLGSFSKIMAPALRLGWMVAPVELIPKLTVIKEAGDLESSALTQRAVSAYLDAGHLPAHLDRLRQAYGTRRDVMLAALQRHFPAEARWTRPRAGMFVWVELPTHIDTAVLLETAVSQARVAFIPGYAFAVPGHKISNCLRLNFSNCSPELIDEGIARLGDLIRHAV